MIVKQGEVYFADLSPVMGAEQGGIRPVLIVQNDIANRFAPTVIIAAITAQISEEKLPTHIKLSTEKYPFPKDSIVLMEQVRTIDKVRLSDKICKLDNVELERVHLAWNLSGGTIPFDYIEKQDDIKNFYKFIKGKTFEHLEDYEYEFKEIMGKNPVNSIKDTIGPNMCSFLNSKGGRIIYGITNKERTIVGFNATSQDIDEIKKVIYDQLNTLSPTITPEIIEINLMPLYADSTQLENHYVLEVLVHAPRDKSIIYFLKGDELYVRVDGKKQRLKGVAIVDHIINRNSRK